MVRLFRRALLLGAMLLPGWAAHGQPLPAERSVDTATVLSSFGGRAAFSPDGRKIAFVGKTYGDAYEIDIATRKVRNLTRHMPHLGIMRIQYLPSGDFLVTAPRHNSGPNVRAHLEMWILDKSLSGGLQPLGEAVFEGIAVSRKRNLIAWTTIEPALKPAENWQLAFIRPTKRYVAEIVYRNGTPAIANKREIMATLPKECGFIEPQDFRANDEELVYSCMGSVRAGDFTISVMGNRIATNENIVYLSQPGRYNEVEGIAPDGSWAAVECGQQDKPGLPALDICALELRPGGTVSRMVVGTKPGSSADISNPVVSPDGQWMAFQRSDSGSGEIGEGYGLLMTKIAR
ncbi:hypothetical protein LWE61_17250 [Sphingobium sufflavum]|uniref:hypothetical protein n=1 Tax=Sphingobium sufflavum TaxID=1129547 RepID=UPI001F2DBCC6|nr:hypothetical protein [Sphingobium sufflavum]MCE7798286.1 hypothetical protein [Sphingobium sufflavum]